MGPAASGAGAGSGSRLGRAGESAAARLLEQRGYRVIGRGFLARRGEIDLVCRRGQALVMVEVKARSSSRFGAPSEAVGPAKRRALLAASAEYRALAGWRGQIEFAVVGLVMDRAGNVISADLVENPFG